VQSATKYTESIQEKHIRRKRKNNKEIIKANH